MYPLAQMQNGYATGVLLHIVIHGHRRILPSQLLLRGNCNKWAGVRHQLCPVVNRNHKHDQYFSCRKGYILGEAIFAHISLNGA